MQALTLFMFQMLWRMKMENTELSSEKKIENEKSKDPPNHMQVLTLFMFQMLSKQRLHLVHLSLMAQLPLLTPQFHHFPLTLQLRHTFPLSLSVLLHQGLGETTIANVTQSSFLPWLQESWSNVMLIHKERQKLFHINLQNVIKALETEDNVNDNDSKGDFYCPQTGSI